jgi:hypothetical protein
MPGVVLPLHGEWFSLTRAEVESFPILAGEYSARILNLREPTPREVLSEVCAEPTEGPWKTLGRSGKLTPEWCTCVARSHLEFVAF